MNEKFLQFIWKHRLFREDALILPSGEKIKVIETGQQNSDAGPDFINARIEYDGIQWAGNVEIHQRASDWKKHHHHLDKSYDNVILHLVQIKDAVVQRSKGDEIPSVEMQYDTHYENKYQQLLHSERWIPCEHAIQKIDMFTMAQWLTSLAIERINRKTEKISQCYDLNQQHWEETFFQTLCMGFGMDVNALPFELLGKSISINILGKHRDNLQQIEALLFGQAGMLEKETGDDYYLALRSEYQFLKHKYQLQNIEEHLWKFLRLRPGNFPTLRIAQLASMIHRNEFLFSKLVENISPQTLNDMFNVSASTYWDTHYTFNKKQIKANPKHFAGTAKDTMLINVIIPFLFLYAQKKGLPDIKDNAINILENIHAEDNAIIRNFSTRKVYAKNALESQALIELKKQYCNHNACLSCRIGGKIILGEV